MGNVLTFLRWRNKQSPSIESELQTLAESLKKIKEQEANHNARCTKLWWLSLQAYFAVLALGCITFLFMSTRLNVIIQVMLVAIALIYAVYKSLNVWYSKILVANNTQKTTIKKKLHEKAVQVVDTVPYLTAHSLLEQYVPEYLFLFNIGGKTAQNQARLQNAGVRRRMGQGSELAAPPPPPLPSMELVAGNPALPSKPASATVQTISPFSGSGAHSKSFLMRVAEAITGDNPTSRYALICRMCHRHNGLALPEDYPYMVFRCCECGYFNEAKIQRPPAPKLNFSGNSRTEEKQDDPLFFEQDSEEKKAEINSQEENRNSSFDSIADTPIQADTEDVNVDDNETKATTDEPMDMEEDFNESDDHHAQQAS